MTEYIFGETLDCRLQRRGRLPLGEALHIIQQILRVLEYLHKRGVIYRDLKPANIMLEPDDTARLIDFGAVRNWKRGARRDTIPFGTPGFAPPEQYGTAQSDARSDVYSAGVSCTAC